MECIFISDLHGKIKRINTLFKIIKEEKPEAVFIGGDILPNEFSIKESIEDFLNEKFFLKIKKIKQSIGNNIRFFVILGNDDPRIYEQLFIKADKENIIYYINEKTVGFDKFFVTGYSYIPPTPFQLKDWEKYDISRFNDVGVVSPEEGQRTIPVTQDQMRYSTISDDLKKISKNRPVEKTIYLFHSPPYKTNLDRADLDDRYVDHAPFDVHVGSIAIRRFIEKKQPFLTLHGHIHESVRLTGKWVEKIGNTYSFSAAHDGDELAIVKFNTEKLEEAVRLVV